MKQRFMISYDIRDNRRLQRVQRRLSKQSWMLQYSVYLGELPEERLSALRSKLQQMVKPEDDLRVYSVLPRQVYYWWGRDFLARGIQWYGRPVLVPLRQERSKPDKLVDERPVLVF